MNLKQFSNNSKNSIHYTENKYPIKNQTNELNKHLSKEKDKMGDKYIERKVQYHNLTEKCNQKLQ